MPPKPNLKFKPKLSAGASPPLTSLNEEDFDENTSLEAMALQLQQESSFSYRGGAFDFGKATTEATDNIHLYPKTAPHLPANTMSSLLLPGDGRGAHGHVYTPIPLNHKDAAQAIVAERAARDHHSTSRAATAPPKGRPTRTAAAAKTEDEDRGVAFLREGAHEDERAWAANRCFHEQILQPNVLTSSSSPSSHADRDGDLVWLQMPRFYENAPFDLSTMEPGKVGELVVLKSGRMLLRIHNVYYDVSASGEESGATNPTALKDKGALEGPCSMAVISSTTASPAQAATGERPTLSCYEVGLLTKKLVCTPTISENL